MATRRLLNLSRMSNKPSTFTSHSRSTSQSSAVAGQISSPASRSPPVMLYDRLSEEVKFKLRRLENPDQRFLRHASPHPAVADHSAILSSPETRITTLPNGLRVATESDLAARTATVGVWIDSGSRFEGDDANGAAHFLESVIFQGTEKKPAVGNVGGQLNACTCREQTNYCATVMGKDAPKAVDALAGMLQNSSFEQKQIDRLRRLILRRAEDVEGRAKEVVFDHLHATAFQHTPLGRTILGTAESIQTITKAHIQNYVSTHYAAHRMVVVAAGAVKHEEIVERVKQQFTKLSANPVTTTQLVSNEPAVFTGSEVRIIDDYDHIARLAVAFKGASWTDPDSIALMVMQHLLGSWNKNGLGGKHVGSSLGQRVGITGIAESMTAFNTQYKDTGLFGVYAVAKPDCLDDLVYAIMYEMSKLSYRVADEDVIRAQNQLKSSLLRNVDGTRPTAEDIGRQLLAYGRRIPFAELFARIDAVDAATVKRVANRFLFDTDVAFAAMGAVRDLRDYNWFRRRTYLLRY